MLLAEKPIHASWTMKQSWMMAELSRFRHELKAVKKQQPLHIQRAFTYIHDHVFEPGLNVGRVRAHCNLGNNNVSALFRQTTGMGLREYIEDLRLRAACRLLRLEELEIYMIADAVGYEHQETFFRAFRRRYGYPPSIHREE